MKRAMASFRGVQENVDIAFICGMPGGVLQGDTMEDLLWRETLGRSLGSYDAAELVGGMCHGNGCWQETTRLHVMPYTTTG